MRAIVRVVPIVLALLVASGSGAAAAAKRGSSGDCAVPRGWTVVGRNSRSVVIGKFVTAPLGYEGKVLWEYCLRPNGHFRRLATINQGPYSYGVGGAKLVGLYFGYWEAQGYHGAYVHATLYLWHLTTRRVAEATYDDKSGDCYEPFGSAGPANRPPAAFPGVRAGYLLTSAGVAAWKADRCAYDTFEPVEDIEVFDSSTGQSVTLDSASTHGALANLQLYQCATGCRADTTVVAWTDDEVQRYSTVG